MNRLQTEYRVQQPGSTITDGPISVCTDQTIHHLNICLWFKAISVFRNFSTPPTQN